MTNSVFASTMSLCATKCMMPDVGRRQRRVRGGGGASACGGQDRPASDQPGGGVACASTMAIWCAMDMSVPYIEIERDSLR